MDSLCFLNHSEFILKILFIGLLITLSTLFLFKFFYYNRSIYTSKNEKTNRFRLSIKKLFKYIKEYSRKKNQLTKLNLIMIFFILFNQINLNLLTNSIKTNEVIVVVDDVIDTLPKLFETKRYACWLESETGFVKAKNSESSNYMRKIYDLKRRKADEICTLDIIFTDYDEIEKIELDKVFFLNDKTVLQMLLSYISRYRKVDIVFENLIFDCESILVHYLSSQFLNDPQTNSLAIEILDKIINNFEFGFYRKLYDDIENISAKLIWSGTIFTSVSQMKDSFLKNLELGTLDLKYFHDLFSLLLSFYLLLIFSFIFSLVFGILRKLLRFIILCLIELKYNLRAFLKRIALKF